MLVRCESIIAQVTSGSNLCLSLRWYRSRTGKGVGNPRSRVVTLALIDPWVVNEIS